ncbi:DUF3100 domain-containing protein [Oceanispirochaeta sp.]|jgi:hypothetical protein|uniref:DUF3100 domain-containing protein n=1 Tax=Oceanispirochaeta sp. TaxID=2035350 RepID=UPI0026248EB6|nr:DUF3100 domain-containing protein [Oceanispirochaeta sp.]MDA3955641.1 DUF3100 domain-containing protein [Oceanispirochaeta sp.]
MTEKETLSWRGRSRIFLTLLAVVLVLVIISELIGIVKISVGPGTVVLLPMLFAVILGMLITPDLLGKKIKVLKKIVNEDTIELAGVGVMIALLPLGVRYGTLVGPNIVKVLEAGPALILQELGNLFTPLIALPIALLLGLKREAVGATVSICREPTLGVIGEKYGMSSPEGNGVLGTYMVGTVFGTVFFGFLGSLAVNTGLHPYALAMATGVGSGSMMAAGSAALAVTVPAVMKDTVLAYAATSNMLTGITGIYSVIFLALPFTNWYYNKIEPKINKNKKTVLTTEGE